MSQDHKDNSAEHQRRRRIGADARSYEARDRLAKTIHDQNVKDGKNTTFDQAHREASRIAELAKKKKGKE